jgi:ribosomal protein L7/L12
MMANWRELTLPGGEKTWLNLDRAEGMTRTDGFHVGLHTEIRFSGGTVGVVETPQQILGSPSGVMYDVVVTHVGHQKIHVLRAVRGITRWDLRLVLDAVENCRPIPVPAEAAEAFAEELREYGATVEMTRCMA